MTVQSRRFNGPLRRIWVVKSSGCCRILLNLSAMVYDLIVPAVNGQLIVGFGSLSP
jgi:hypothetical protein